MIFFLGGGRGTTSFQAVIYVDIYISMTFYDIMLSIYLIYIITKLLGIRTYYKIYLVFYLFIGTHISLFYKAMRRIGHK